MGVGGGNLESAELTVEREPSLSDLLGAWLRTAGAAQVSCLDLALAAIRLAPAHAETATDPPGD